MRDIRTLCDRCLNPGAEPYEIPTGRYRACPAGGRSEDIMLTADLCRKCTAEILKLVLKCADEPATSVSKVLSTYKRHDKTHSLFLEQ